MRSAADASGSWSDEPRPVPCAASAPSRSSSSRSSCWRCVRRLQPAEDLLAWDVRFAYLPAAEAVLDGRSPYPALDDPILEDQKGYVYPPQLVLALVPFTWLPVDVVALLVDARAARARSG